jgi:hypothetical protein
MFSGCATNVTSISSPEATATGPLNGKLFGGQQPVSGATIQLYAAGVTGYGSASTPLFTEAVVSDSNGNFTFTGDYTCPAGAQVYLVATGGNPGMPAGTVNNNLALMAAIGPCSSITSSTNVMVNERSTIAAVWALSHFMSGYSAIGSSATNTAGLANAFSIVPELVTLDTGITPGAALPAGATVSVAEINTLSDILAPCINSAGGTAGDNSLCGQLFSATTVSGSPAPQDTIAAALNIARNPTLNTAQLFTLAASNSPFQPTLPAAPQNYLLSMTYAGAGLNAPAALAVDASGNVWAANAANSTLSELNSTGVALSPVTGFTGGGLNGPSSLALDFNGTVWVTNRNGNNVSLFNSSGAPLPASPLNGGGLNAPSAIAIDEDGGAWITNSGNNSISNFSSSFLTISPSTGYTGGGLSQPTAIAINPQ